VLKTKDQSKNKIEESPVGSSHSLNEVENTEESKQQTYKVSVVVYYFRFTTSIAEQLSCLLDILLLMYKMSVVKSQADQILHSIANGLPALVLCCRDT